MLAKGLRTHSLYNYAADILSYINIVYKPRNIPVHVKGGCRLLIKTVVFIQHLIVKVILLHGLYNTWKTFTLLYGPSTVNPLCCDAAYDSCGASSCAPHADQYPAVKPANRAQCCSVCPVTKKVVILPMESTIWGGFLLLCWLSVSIDALVPSKTPFSNPPKLCGTLCWPPNCRWLVTVLPQGNVKLHFDLFFTAYFNGGWREVCGKVVEIDDSCFSGQKCNCGRLCTTVWVFVGVEEELGTPVLHFSVIAPLRHCHH